MINKCRRPSPAYDQQRTRYNMLSYTIARAPCVYSGMTISSHRSLKSSQVLSRRVLPPCRRLLNLLSRSASPPSRSADWKWLPTACPTSHSRSIAVLRHLGCSCSSPDFSTCYDLSCLRQTFLLKDAVGFSLSTTLLPSSTSLTAMHNATISSRAHVTH